MDARIRCTLSVGLTRVRRVTKKGVDFPLLLLKDNLSIIVFFNLNDIFSWFAPRRAVLLFGVDHLDGLPLLHGYLFELYLVPDPVDRHLVELAPDLVSLAFTYLHAQRDGVRYASVTAQQSQRLGGPEFLIYPLCCLDVRLKSPIIGRHL